MRQAANSGRTPPIPRPMVARDNIMSQTTDRRGFLQAMGASALAAALARVAHAQGRQPNILFMMTDDHAAHAISCYGSRINQTPHLDRLAAGGMRFENCFCTNSICAPSRAVILTGKYSHLNGHIDNRSRFDGSQQTIPKVMGPAGYQTAMIGKWHLVSDPTGFDYWHILPGQGAYHNPPMIEMGHRVQHQGYATDLITDFSLDWIRQRDPNKPFFLMSQHKAPHRSWEPAERHKDLFKDVDIPEPATLHDDYRTRSAAAREQEMTIAYHLNKGDLKGDLPPEDMSERERESRNYQIYIKDYLRCVQAVDENVGRVLDFLDEQGLADNTIVVYTSDQGFYLGDHGWFDKRFMYEPSLRMPLLIRWPGVTAPASVNRDLVLNLDFAETFADAAGLPLPEGMQGRSLVPLLKGQAPADWRDAIYYHYYEFPAVHQVKRHYGIRTKRYKLIHFYYDIDAWELYDLESDPDELHNRIDDPAMQPLIAQLKQRLAELQQQYADDTAKAPQQPAGHPDFPEILDGQVTAHALGYQLAADGQAYAFRKTAKVYQTRATFKVTVQTLRQTGTRNALIAFGAEPKPESCEKAGLYLGAGDLIVQHEGFGSPEGSLKRLPIKFDAAAPQELTIDVDLKARTIKVSRGDDHLEAAMAQGFEQIAWVGMHAASTEAAFSKIEETGE